MSSEFPNTNIGPPLDAPVIGVGFADIYMLHQLRTVSFNVNVFEGVPEVGGSWYWNKPLSNDAIDLGKEN